MNLFHTHIYIYITTFQKVISLAKDVFCNCVLKQNWMAQQKQQHWEP